MGIDDLSFRLIVEMRKAPLDSLRDYASRLGVSANTIRNRIGYLKEKEFIRGDKTIHDPLLGERVATDVVAHHSPYKLGLLRIHIIIETKASHKEKIKHMLQNHPYTYYYVIGMSKTPVVYAILDIPLQTYDLIIDLLDELNEGKIILAYHVLRQDYFVGTQDNMQSWEDYIAVQTNEPQQNERDREDSPGTLKDSLTSAFNQNMATNYTPTPYPTPLDPPILDRLDLNLIRELTINAKIQATELAKYYNKERSTLSRRIQKIKENYIEGYTLHYDRDKSNLNTAFLIYGKLDLKMLNVLHKVLTERQFPYYSNFQFSDQGIFVWQLFVPAKVCNLLVHSLFGNYNSIHLVLLNPRDSIRYFFYTKNYDEEQSSWKVNKSYLVI